MPREEIELEKYLRSLIKIGDKNIFHVYKKDYLAKDAKSVEFLCGTAVEILNSKSKLLDFHIIGIKPHEEHRHFIINIH